MSDIEELSTEERIAVVSKYILQAPPGEVNDVVADVRQLLDDDVIFKGLLPAALKEYHHSQYTAVDVPGQSYQTIIAPAASLPVEPAKYFEPRGSQTFDFDPVKLTASNFEPFTTISEPTTTFLSTIQPLLQTYISNHFSTGTASVFPTFIPGPPPPPPAAAPTPAPEAAPVPAADEPAVEQPKEEDPAVETALVATADEVVAVAEELKITDDDVEDKKVEDGTWDEAAEGDAMKGVEEPVAEAAASSEKQAPTPAQDEEEAAPAPVEETKMDVVTPATEEIKEEAVAEPTPAPAAVSAEPEVAPAPAGPNVEVVDGKYTIVTSGFRYSPQNFWTGRWRSSYAVDLTQSTLTGSIEVVVHYYEQGNVQLRTTSTPTLTLSSSSTESAPKDIIAAISKAERAAQEGINTRLEQLADKAFKSLRRALPVTRQKMEWEKVGGYKLGDAIGGKGQPQREEVEAQV